MKHGGEGGYLSILKGHTRIHSFFFYPLSPLMAPVQILLEIAQAEMGRKALQNHPRPHI